MTCSTCCRVMPIIDMVIVDPVATWQGTALWRHKPSFQPCNQATEEQLNTKYLCCDCCDGMRWVGACWGIRLEDVILHKHHSAFDSSSGCDPSCDSTTPPADSAAICHARAHPIHEAINLSAYSVDTSTRAVCSVCRHYRPPPALGDLIQALSA